MLSEDISLERVDYHLEHVQWVNLLRDRNGDSSVTQLACLRRW